MSRERTPGVYATLDGRAVSHEGKALVGRVFALCLDWEREHAPRKARSRQEADTLLYTIEAFLYDLLRAHGTPSANGWVYRSLRPGEFTGELVSYRALSTLVGLMVRTRLLEHRPGHGRWVDWGDGKNEMPGEASRFKAGAALLSLATETGVNFAAIGEHFRPGLPDPPLILREGSFSARGIKQKGGRLPLPDTERARRLAEELRELNAFLDGFPLKGGEHYGFLRVFAQGDTTLQSGGRLYSQTDELSYQQLHRDDRLKMELAGEKVCELDIRASFLTIVHARLGLTFDPRGTHPYARADGVEQAVGKAWCVAALGQSQALPRWPADTRNRFAKETGRNLSKVCKATIAGERLQAFYPALRRLEDPQVHWAVLQYVESEAIVNAMRRLMLNHGIPSLSVHDSLITPRSKQALAKEILEQAYEEAVGVIPVVTVKVATDDE
jgi:hypothetical protein